MGSGASRRRFRSPRWSLRGLASLALCALLAACGSSEPEVELRIVSGSENKALQPIVEAWAEEANVAVEIDYLGSVDISRALAEGASGPYDAVWPAHSLWIELGDETRATRHAASILRSPVVLGLKRSIAERLGWVGRDDVSIQEIAEAAERGAFRLAMTSATQSNSGASSYLGFLYAMAGDPDLLTLEHLAREDVRDGVRGLLGSVDRSSGSSGWLKEAFVENFDRFDAMMNYEALIIEANLEIEARGRSAPGLEPLYVVYPANGLAVADSPLALVARGGEGAAAREEAFLALQRHLLSEETQASLAALGRRAGLLGLGVETSGDADLARAWNAAWGVDPGRAIAPAPTPRQEVIREALRLYQTELRKPSLTVWVLDVSGSMEGEPLAQLKRAMELLLDKRAAALNLLEPSARDVTAVIAFNDRVVGSWVVEGANEAELRALLEKVRGLEAGGGTDLYRALVRAIDVLKRYDADGRLFERLPAIVAMTDGDSETDNRRAFRTALGAARFGRDAPIHAIAFGEANETQLRELTDATIGRLFEASGDLAGALRRAKGYN